MSNISLRIRLLIAVGSITLLALGLADVVVFGALHSYLYNQVDTSLEMSHRALEMTADNPQQAETGGSVFVPSGLPPSENSGPRGAVGRHAPPTAPEGPGSSAFCAIGRLDAPGMFIEVRDATGQVVTGVAGREECPSIQPGSVSYTPRLPSNISGLTNDGAHPSELSVYFTSGSVSSNGPAFRVRASRLSGGDVLIVATPISGISDTLSQLLLVELLVTAGALFTAVVLGLWLVRVGLRPLRDVETTAEAIAAGDLMLRVPSANTRTEVGRLATAFNVMVERIETLVSDLRSSESRLRRFVGDASHELRTPIAAISAYAQLFGKGAASEKDALERAMSGIERESNRMAGLVEDLLTLAKLDEHQLLAPQPVELVGLALESVETARLVGPGWPVSVQASSAIEVLGDYAALRRVVDNLLSNVRAHTPPGSRATVNVGAAGNEGYIEVSDDGPGITTEQARLVFERFFRVDRSRSRTTGGAGLGLAIVASIVEVHGGRVAAEPREGGGAVFRVTIPLLASEHDSLVIDDQGA